MYNGSSYIFTPGFIQCISCVPVCDAVCLISRMLCHAIWYNVLSMCFFPYSCFIKKTSSLSCINFLSVYTLAYHLTLTALLLSTLCSRFWISEFHHFAEHFFSPGHWFKRLTKWVLLILATLHYSPHSVLNCSITLCLQFPGHLLNP